MSAYEHGFSPAETATWIEGQLRRYRDDGFGLWAVTDAETDEVIGDCGLTVQRTATAEVVEACLDWGFANVVVPEIYAIVRDTNLASMNVAIRLGMTVRERFVKHYRDIDMPHLAFAVSRAAWRSRHPSP